MNITPFLRTPFTDIFGPLSTLQRHPECAPYEMKVVDCMEAYGIPRGREKCRILMEDFRECLIQSKQVARISIMRAERQRQWEEGERKEQFAEDIKIDSY